MVIQGAQSPPPEFQAPPFPPHPPVVQQPLPGAPASDPAAAAGRPKAGPSQTPVLMLFGILILVALILILIFVLRR
jgi:LPXTG-motif cell wall-anchored protein